ncbi:exoglucanase-6A [Polytolypa hystricis UAMH7299]|uniref:Exoglucanase-6A n=1 Tax=Polytolypa hystricis (strain UAMH7299) TaxID=1447883 RepID=A0A2B7YZI8_POLH7|nr:exoglucanase-6A [Polytolypa hystricis UAMH7299]
MRFTTASLLLVGQALAGPTEKRQNCPAIHVFGARETTVGPGFGSSGSVVNSVLSAYPGSTSEAIVYPACGGQGSCGGVSYQDSAAQGSDAVVTAVNNLNQRCPDTKIVLIGYSQGGQIMDNAVCGGPDTGVPAGVRLTASAVNQVKAAIFMGSPRYVSGLPYNVGTCTASGFAARPAGFTCPNASKVKNYCDAQDPYCCNGNDANHHQQYGSIYGSQALAFIRSQIDASGGGDNGGGDNGGGDNGGGDNGGGNNGGNCVAKWGQCGGSGHSGPTCCESGSTCNAQNEWYSQCI